MRHAATSPRAPRRSVGRRGAAPAQHRDAHRGHPHEERQEAEAADVLKWAERQTQRADPAADHADEDPEPADPAR
jgi:hypothetical protein